MRLPPLRNKFRSVVCVAFSAIIRDARSYRSRSSDDIFSATVVVVASGSASAAPPPIRCALVCRTITPRSACDSAWNALAACEPARATPWAFLMYASTSEVGLMTWFLSRLRKRPSSPRNRSCLSSCDAACVAGVPVTAQRSRACSPFAWLAFAEPEPVKRWLSSCTHRWNSACSRTHRGQMNVDVDTMMSTRQARQSLFRQGRYFSVPLVMSGIAAAAAARAASPRPPTAPSARRTSSRQLP